MIIRPSLRSDALQFNQENSKKKINEFLLKLKL